MIPEFPFDRIQEHNIQQPWYAILSYQAKSEEDKAVLEKALDSLFLCTRESNHGLESNRAPPAVETLETHP